MIFFKTTFNTPILLLGFNRPDKFSRVLNRIISQRPSKLYIALDGPRNITDQIALEKIKIKIQKIPSYIHLKTFFRQENLGCGKAVSSAINWFFENEEMGIILEDDTLPNTTFFQFCEKMLKTYKDETRVGHISGNNFFPYTKLSEHSYWFSCYNHIWGWATWKRVWDNYSFSLESINEEELQNSLLAWNYGEEFQFYWLNIYKKMQNLEIDTWDYQYTLMCLAKHYLTIIPRYNLVDNIGFGSDATHTKGEKPISIQKVKNYNISKFPSYPEIKANTLNDKYVNQAVFGISSK